VTKTKESENILVVDDEPQMAQWVKDLLSEEGFNVQYALSAEEAVQRLASDPYHLVITDLRMQKMTGMDLLKKIQTEWPEILVILVTAFGTVESAIEAMKGGAYDYITKPFKSDELILTVKKAFEQIRLKGEVRRLREEISKEYQFENIIGKSKKLKEIYNLIRRISQSTVNVLITGESGTGKDLIAKAIHYNSPRKDRPFVAINCAAIPETLLESELFGHAKGAFTDAKGDKKGLFEEAEGGTLFLDEIGELPISLQAKLLRAIQDREIRRVGSNRSIPVDIRIISASNLDLKEQVRKRLFREDLYYRINVLEFSLPPLRDRKEDIALLVHHFIQKYGNNSNKKIGGMTETAMAALLDYPWPGNVRELENAIERAVTLCQGEKITLDDLPPTLSGNQPGRFVLDEALQKQLPLEAVEREYVQRIMDLVGGNKVKAAHILQIDRKTLYRKLATPPSSQENPREA
jgi:DNA-binding NtrC family response regulator